MGLDAKCEVKKETVGEAVHALGCYSDVRSAREQSAAYTLCHWGAIGIQSGYVYRYHIIFMKCSELIDHLSSDTNRPSVGTWTTGIAVPVARQNNDSACLLPIILKALQTGSNLIHDY